MLRLRTMMDGFLSFRCLLLVSEPGIGWLKAKCGIETAFLP